MTDLAPSPFPAPTPTPSGNFTVNVSGPGRVPIPIYGTTINLRVSIDPALSPHATWAWCFDSTFGLAPNALDSQSPKWLLYCGADGLFNPSTGYLDVFKTIQIDPNWPANASYFLHMLCLTSCVWQLEVRQ